MAFFNLSEKQLSDKLRELITYFAKTTVHDNSSHASCSACDNIEEAHEIITEISYRIERAHEQRRAAIKERDDQRARADSAMRELERLRASVTRFSFPPEATNAIPQRMALVSISDLADIDTLRDERDKLSEQLVQADKATREARARQIQLMEENARLQNRAVSETEKIWRDYNSRPRLFW